MTAGRSGKRCTGCLAWEEQAILDLIEQWGWVDRSHRKLAHRGSYTGSVFVSPSTLLRVALKHRVALPGEPIRPRPVSPVFPEVPWERNRIWIWDATHFPRSKRVAYAIVDVVTRYWIGYLLTSEQTSTQAQLLFARALEDQDLLDAEGLPPAAEDGLPILVAWSDNGTEMTATDTRQFMALMAITQHHGRPSTPTDQAHIESFFSHLKGDWPHLTGFTDPAALDTELHRIRGEYNSVRLHAAIGYVTPDDEHTAAGPASAGRGRRASSAPASSGSSRIELTSDDERRDHRSRPSRPASVGRSVPARGGRPTAMDGRRNGHGRRPQQPPTTSPPPASALG